MKSKLCVLNAAVFVFFVCPAIAGAQAPAEHRWVWGLGGGKGARTADAFFEGPWYVKDGVILDRLVCRDPENASSIYVGRFINRFVHIDAVMGFHFGGFGCGLGLAGVGVAGTYLEYAYQGTSPGTDFATTSARVMVEPGRAEWIVLPRASVSVGTILEKWDPTATVTGGAGIGSSGTRFTVDIGQQFYWIKYQLRVRHVVNDQVADETIETGTQKPRGMSVRLGIQHAF